MSPMEQALDALGRGQGAWTKDTAQNLADLIAAKDARIERLQALLNIVRIQMKNQDRRENEEPLYRAICQALAGKEGP